MNIPRAAISLVLVAAMIAVTPGSASCQIAAAEFQVAAPGGSAAFTGMPVHVPNVGLVAPGAAPTLSSLTQLPGAPALALAAPAASAASAAPATSAASAAPAAAAEGAAANELDLAAASPAAAPSAAPATKEGKRPTNIAEMSRQFELDLGAARDITTLAADDAEALGRHAIGLLDGEGTVDAAGSAKKDAIADREARQNQSVPRKVGALRVLVRDNPAEALSAAGDILRNPEERRYEVRVAALRALATIKSEAADAELLRALESENGYYLKIETTKMIGAAASRIPKEKAVPVLEKLYLNGENQSVRIAARWALGRYGIEKPEVAYDYKQVIVTAGMRLYAQVKSHRTAILTTAAIASGAAWLAQAHAAGQFTFTGAWNVFLNSVLPVAYPVLTLAMIGGLIWWTMRRGGGGSSSFTKMRKIQAERPDVTFDDIAGIDDASVEIKELVDILKDPVRFKQLGAKLPKGVLLKGPPGTGKTLMAKALAGSAGVPFYSVSGSDFNEVFVGVGSRRMRDIFEEAKKHAPSIIFIDEFDAVAKTRSNYPGSNESNNTLNALLTEMDGFDASTDVIVIAATNLDASLDSAATRPGRFDRSIYVGNPHILGREAILQIHAKSRRLGPDVDLRRIAERTTGFSGAALASLVNEAALLAARRRATTLMMRDFDDAVDKMLVGSARELFMNKDVMRRTAEHEIGHVLGHMLADSTLDEVVKNPQKVSSIVSIVPRGEGTLGFAHSSAEEDNPTTTKRGLENDLVRILGGHVAEQVVYGEGDVSTGPGSDLQSASSIARMMVEKAGFSKKLGLEVTAPNANGFSPVSEKTKELKDGEVRRILAAAHRRMTQIFKSNEGLRKLLVTELLKKETLSREEMMQIIREYVRPVK
ncbi:MAG: ATP-dependent zinc metalloprotease FtsH [Elusimicrobia bacterium]|nr:ATP-dependent zinc metalloprotease FtsH [Elusimicrobiota bacterium]